MQRYISDLLITFEKFLNRLLYIFITIVCLSSQTIFAFGQDSLGNDIQIQESFVSDNASFSLLDTLLNPQQVRQLFMPYESIGNNGYVNVAFQLQVSRNMPNLKQIMKHPSNDKRAYFISLLAVVILISVNRLTNPKNFTIFIQSVFDSQLSQRIWLDSKTNFLSIIIQLSITFILTLSIIIAFYLQSRSELLELSFYGILWRSIIVLLGIYLIKFIVIWIIGELLNFSHLSQGLITNTISLNGFLSLLMLPLSIIYIYNSGTFLGNATFYTLVSIFFMGVIFRNLHMFFMAISALRFPIIYLFIYLCALEILPWLLLFKILDNYFV